MSAFHSLISKLMAVDALDAVLALSPVMLLVCGVARAAELGLLP